MSTESHVRCSVCRAETPRHDMFGAEPDLVCPTCADRLRNHTYVRRRAVHKDHKPIATGIMLAICAAVFLGAMQVRGKPLTEWPSWLAAMMQTEEIWIGQWWRHVTCMFVHNQIWHVGMNGMSFWFLGRHMEDAWGPWVVVGLVLITGIGASALEWMFSGPGIGISGGLFGLVGFLWALRKVHPLAAAIMTQRMRNWILTLLAIGVVLSVTGAIPIGNWAHGGGLAIGFLIGLATQHPKRKLLVPATVLAVLALVVAAQFLAFGSTTLVRGDKTTFETPRSEWREIWLRQNGHE